MFDSDKEKNLRIGIDTHNMLNRHAADEGNTLRIQAHKWGKVYENYRKTPEVVINGKKCKPISMESDSFMTGKIKFANMRRTMRVGKDG